MRLLFFTPITNIWAHAFPEAVLAEGARRQGVDVTFATCGSLLRNQCSAMEESRVPEGADEEQRLRVCRTCTARATTLVRSFSFPTVQLSHYFSELDEAIIREHIAHVEPNAWQDFELDGVPLGRFAAYEFLLKHKRNTLEIPQELWSAYLDQLTNTLRSYVAAPRLLDDVRPDRAVAYNTLYAANRAFMAVAERNGVPCYTMQGGNHTVRRAETMTVFRNDQAVFQAPESPAWHAWRDLPIGVREAGIVAEHVAAGFSARSAFTYSKAHKRVPPSATRSSLGLDPQRKTAVVVLSSRDEVFAADVVGRFPRPIDGTHLFPTQAAWIEHVSGIADRRDDLQFVVRVHPREFPNKRESVLSPNAAMLKELLDDLPDNMVVDWPADGRSLYDVIQIADVVMTAWSSVGGEAALFGAPVVAYDTGDLLSYPKELNDYVTTVDDYEPALDRALATGWSLDRARLAFRWYAFNFSRLALDLSASVPSRAAWSSRRILQGLYTQTRVPVPFAAVHFCEKSEIKQRARALVADAVFVDTLERVLPSVAESAAWPARDHVVYEDETAALRIQMLRLAELLGLDDSDPQCLSSRIATGLAAST